MKSIIQLNKNYCYICRELTGYIVERRGLEEHHIFGGPNRKLSEKYGLKVYLCPEHHRTGDVAPHQSKGTDNTLRRIAQTAFERKYSHEYWMQIFRKNYLED